MWNIFKRKKKTVTLVSSIAHCVGDRYEYTIEDCESKEEAILKLIAYLTLKDSAMNAVCSGESCTVSYPGRSMHDTNLPWVVHLGISGERMTEVERRDYEVWKEKARVYVQNKKYDRY